MRSRKKGALVGAARPRSAAPRPVWVRGVVSWGSSPSFFVPFPSYPSASKRCWGGLKHTPPSQSTPPVLLDPIWDNPGSPTLLRVVVTSRAPPRTGIRDTRSRWCGPCPGASPSRGRWNPGREPLGLGGRRWGWPLPGEGAGHGGRKMEPGSGAAPAILGLVTCSFTRKQPRVVRRLRVVQGWLLWSFPVCCPAEEFPAQTLLAHPAVYSPSSGAGCCVGLWDFQRLLGIMGAALLWMCCLFGRVKLGCSHHGLY